MGEFSVLIFGWKHVQNLLLCWKIFQGDYAYQQAHVLAPHCYLPLLTWGLLLYLELNHQNSRQRSCPESLLRIRPWRQWNRTSTFYISADESSGLGYCYCQGVMGSGTKHSTLEPPRAYWEIPGDTRARVGEVGEEGPWSQDQERRGVGSRVFLGQLWLSEGRPGLDPGFMRASARTNHNLYKVDCFQRATWLLHLVTVFVGKHLKIILYLHIILPLIYVFTVSSYLVPQKPLQSINLFTIRWVESTVIELNSPVSCCR